MLEYFFDPIFSVELSGYRPISPLALISFIRLSQVGFETAAGAFYGGLFTT